MKFDLIVADPAWAFNDKLKAMKKQTKRSAESQYQVMSIDEIKALPVPKLAEENCVLALWVPGILLPVGFDVLKAWGFEYKQNYVWVKLKKDHKKETDPNKYTRVGMGRLFRQSHEIALIATKGKVYSLLEDHSQRSVCFDLNQGHSIKPEILQNNLEKMFPSANKLELFARRDRVGWMCLGNAIDGKDLKDSMIEILNIE